jgi:radical SAM protein with 4Fe4S-binding SPASM domain
LCTPPVQQKQKPHPAKFNHNQKHVMRRKILIKLGVYKLIALILRKTSGFPFWENLEIDIQSACNRDCEFCPRFWDRTGIRKDEKGNQIITQMPTQKVYDLIDQAAKLKYKGKVKLHRLSESLIDKRYLDFAKYIKAKGLRLLENTNGDVLRANEKLCQQLDGLIEHITIGLYDYKTESEKQAEIAFWRTRFKKTEVAFSMPPENCIIRQGAKVYTDILRDKRALELPCAQPNRMMLIRYDGKVQLCCEDDGCHFDLGNAFEQSLAEIWWSYKHIKIAKTLEKPGERHQYKRCSQCYNSQTLINLLAKDIPHSHIHIDTPTKMPSEEQFPIQGWIVSYHDIQKVWIKPDIELNLVMRPDVEKVHTQYSYIRGFVGTGHHSAIQENHLTFHYRLSVGEFSHTVDFGE